jgi:CRP/FNR family transcriptional regulator, anaerobic regulatory protein
MLDALKVYLQSTFAFSEEEVDEFFSHFQPLRLEKGERFLSEGQVCNRVGYATKGLVMYVQTIDGVESVCDFLGEGEWISYMKSFTQNTPSDMEIRALEDTEMFVLSKSALEELHVKSPKTLVVRTQLSEKSFVSIATRIAELLRLDAQERYARFQRDFSHLEQRIPQYYIASFLGITPQSLSRIRKNLAEKVSA